MIEIKKCIYTLVKPIIKIIEYQTIKKKAKKTRIHYGEVIENIRKSGRTQLSFAAYVVLDSTFGMDGVFDIMLHNKKHWNPHIVVIPDVSRNFEHAKETYKKTKEFFINKYGKEYVLDGWIPEKDEYCDHINKFDIVYYSNPYDSMVHKFHAIEYACDKDVLPIYVSYGYDVGRYTTLGRLKGIELNLMWKVFADTTYTYDDYKKYQIIKGKNVVLAGYAKMDDLYSYLKNDCDIKTRKKILISPHHTVGYRKLPLSNFLEYYDLIERLPSIFPDVDFVFRPHPFLFTTLKNSNLWTQKDVDNYINRLQKAGIIYSVGGDYHDIFRECDAIVNDCGSFTIEWLYTGKPGCFVYNNNLRKKQLTTLMNKAIETYTIAKSEKDIVDFIKETCDKTTENYIVSQWVKDNVAINYPKVSEFIIGEIDILKMNI